MTREITYPNGRTRKPKYIDHGHLARKIVYWSAVVLVTPLAFAQAVAAKFVSLLEPVARAMSRLRVWSHPCLYGRRFGPPRA